jgi:hypothetical protein
VDDEEVVVLSVQEQKCEHVDNNDDEWVVGSTATHHVVRTKELFTTYKAKDFSTVKMGNTSYSKIVRIGNVCIKTNVGFTVMLKNMRHVPYLCFNLISTPKYLWSSCSRALLLKHALESLLEEATSDSMKISTLMNTHSLKMENLKLFFSNIQFHIPLCQYECKMVAFTSKGRPIN